jgi:predicted dehydrogenase
MNNYPPLRFGVIGVDHRHIFDMVRSLLEVGAECAGYWTSVATQVESGFNERFPQIMRVADRRQLLEDPSIAFVVCAAIPSRRAEFGVEAMRHGKDFMSDKPAIISAAQLAQVKQVQAETGRIFSINFSERFEVRAVTKATELVRAGAIGRVLQTVGLGPHRLNLATRPDWFFDPSQYGGILIDIASHQIDQFMHFTGAVDATVDDVGFNDVNIVTARYGNLAHPQMPGLQDFGEIMLARKSASGYIRVDWFTPDGLATWGDGRLMILGTEGTIELRKYIDIEGRSGKDHLFLVNHQGSQYIDCANEPLPYYQNFCNDVVRRSETAMTHKHCFKVCELALTAQASAQIIQPESKPA